MKYSTIFWLTAISVVFALCSIATAQDNVYKTPPDAMAQIIDAPPTPSVEVGPNKKWMLIKGRPSLPSIEDVSQPELRLGGIRINPRTNGASKPRHFTSLTIKNISDHKERVVSLPVGAKISNIRWSRNGEMLAMTITAGDCIDLWICDVLEAKARPLYNGGLNGLAGGFSWLPDNKTIIAAIIPPGRKSPPESPSVPTGPVIQENTGGKAPMRTFQDLLKNPHDENLFDYYMTSRIVKLGLDGVMKNVGDPAVYLTVSPSPDGNYLMVQTIKKPYSYLLPFYRFPKRVEIWDLAGNLVKVIADLPLEEEIPTGFGAVAKGKRSFGWRADADATLYWVKALDGGDPRKKAELRDRVFALKAPFTDESLPIASCKLRFGGITWGKGDLALLRTSWWKTRQTRTWLIKPDFPEKEAKLLFDLSYEDRYSDPGRPTMTRNSFGKQVLLTDDVGDSLFLRGQGASEEGNRPFLDVFNLSSCKTIRFWRSEAPFYESVVSILDINKGLIITSRESKTDPPNYFLRNLANGELKQITHFPHPFPQLKEVSSELIRYKRDDGVQLTGTLYLPPGYSTEKGPIPVLMWAYPREFKSAKAAGQVGGSPYQFIRISPFSPLLWLTHGYAVLNGPTMPIIGEGEEEPNDTFVKQLVASAKAAKDEMIRRGVGDKDRMAIGGHSYGAFMTANLLAHSDLFAAGIARSGAYNRTLTPFGFQSEERTYWEAPNVYFDMSPFMHAPRINEPILLIHGEADNNSGTFPLQSERFYHALKGHGARARLVMLPHESHGYRARESVMHMIWEMTVWLDKYVKNPKAK